MSVSVLDMSISLDGFIADPGDFLGGENGERLHEWFIPEGEPGRLSGPSGEFQDEWSAAGAVLSGRRTAELMDHWGGSHDGAPIFVPSHRPPGPAARWNYPLVTYVTGNWSGCLWEPGVSGCEHGEGVDAVDAVFCGGGEVTA